MSKGKDFLIARLSWLIENEGSILADNFGRQWKFEDCEFYFKDTRTDSVLESGLRCEHLLMGDPEIHPKR